MKQHNTTSERPWKQEVQMGQMPLPGYEMPKTIQDILYDIMIPEGEKGGE